MKTLNKSNVYLNKNLYLNRKYKAPKPNKVLNKIEILRYGKEFVKNILNDDKLILNVLVNKKYEDDFGRLFSRFYIYYYKII